MTKPINKSWRERSTKEAESEEIARGVIKIVGRGNVNLQLGRYVTEEDKEELRRRMREHVMSKESN